MKAMVLQQILGLLLFLAFVDAQEYFTLNDEDLERDGNWSIQPRASGTFACSQRPQVVTLSSGDVATFTSPGYPSSYPNRNSCGWKFRANPSSASITVTCSAFTLQPSRRGRCRDYLKLGKTKYCGSDGPNSVTVTVRRILKISFKSDRRLNNLGFTCTATIDGTVVTLPPVVTNPPSGRCVCGKANRGTRIVGGQTTETNYYP
ncbi:unnamed protein product, partial [Meganyctiphanes norvegica]